MIASVVVLAVKKCAADPSPYVRKAAAYAIPKVYEYVQEIKLAAGDACELTWHTQIGFFTSP